MALSMAVISSWNAVPSGARVRAASIGSGLSISVSNPEVDLGEMKTGASKVSLVPIGVVNDGESSIDLKLSLSDPAGWAAVSYSTGTPGQGQYRLFGSFALVGAQPPAAQNYTADDIISVFPKVMSMPAGRGVPPGKQRNLFCRFDSSGKLASSEESLGVTLNITAAPSSDRRRVKTIGKWGGELSFNDGTTLKIPSFALAGDREITMVELYEDEAPPRKRTGSRAAGFGALSMSSSADEEEAPVCAFALYPDGLQLGKPAEAAMLYSKSKLERLGASSGDLKAYCWDGTEWLLIPGALDPENGVFRAQISRFAYVALFPAGNLSEADYRPAQSVITPAVRDGINDQAFFPNQSGDFEIFIYDLTGRQVRRLSADSGTGTAWDGTDERGRTVESGVYLYQFKADVEGRKKLISGTIAVAK